MNTELSDQKVAEMTAAGPQYERKVINHTQTLQTTPDKLFPLLCDNLDGTTTGNWIVNATALTEQGNEVLKKMKPEDEPIGGRITFLTSNRTSDATVGFSLCGVVGGKSSHAGVNRKRYPLNDSPPR